VEEEKVRKEKAANVLEGERVFAGRYTKPLSE